MKTLLPIFLLINSFLVSAQSGINWGNTEDIASNSFSNNHPRISLAADGNPLVIWGRSSDQSVVFSRWDGTMFTAPVQLNGSLTVASASWMGSDIASHGDTVYVVMKQTPEDDTSSHIYIVHSYNGGTTFSSPQRVDFIADSVSRFPTVTCDATGNPIVAFMKFNNSFLDSRWVVTKSTDFGNTFSVDVKASGWKNSAEVCDCCPGAILSQDNYSAMLYRDNNSNIRDTWMGVSTNNSVSFDNGCNVDNNNWMLMSCPSSGPDGIIIGDTVYSVFMNGGSGKSRTYLSKSSLSAVSVNSVDNLTGTITGLTQQNFPRIASDGNAVAIVWRQTISGNVQLPILFTKDIADGLPVAYDTVDLVDITNADVAIADGKVWVVWQDDNSQTVKYRSGTYSTSTTGISQLEENNLIAYPNPVTDILSIKFKNEIPFAEISVLNVLGKVVLKKNVKNTNNTTLQVGDLANGIYFIQIRSLEQNITKQIIINK
ncbi:MAG: T9SS type A sorting domain-containing protein [Saprospiraceae bacterium]